MANKRSVLTADFIRKDLRFTARLTYLVKQLKQSLRLKNFPEVFTFCMTRYQASPASQVSEVLADILRYAPIHAELFETRRMSFDLPNNFYELSDSVALKIQTVLDEAGVKMKLPTSGTFSILMAVEQEARRQNIECALSEWDFLNK